MFEWAIPTSGSCPACGQHVVEVHQRLAHAHEHRVVHSLLAPEVQRLVEDLRRAEIAAEAHLTGGAEGAGERQPDWLDTHSERRAVVEVRMSTASTGRPSAVSNSAFSAPSPASASRTVASEENGTSRVSRSRRPSADWSFPS